MPHVETTEVMHAQRSNRIRCDGESPQHRLLDTDSRQPGTDNRLLDTNTRLLIGRVR
jgi:hypothetical protein